MSNYTEGVSDNVTFWIVDDHTGELPLEIESIQARETPDMYIFLDDKKKYGSTFWMSQRIEKVVLDMSYAWGLTRESAIESYVSRQNFKIKVARDSIVGMEKLIEAASKLQEGE